MMRYIKLFESYKDIEALCKKYNIYGYTINNDNSVDVDHGVYMSNRNLQKIPIKFGKINGSFECSSNNLTSLENIAKYIDGDVVLSFNNLSSLKYLQIYNGKLDVRFNNILSFDIKLNRNEYIAIDANPIQELINLFRTFDNFLEYLNIYNFQKPDSNIIYLRRLIEALSDLNGKEIFDIPHLKNYIYV